MPILSSCLFYIPFYTTFLVTFPHDITLISTEWLAKYTVASFSHSTNLPCLLDCHTHSVLLGYDGAGGYECTGDAVGHWRHGNQADGGTAGHSSRLPHGDLPGVAARTDLCHPAWRARRHRLLSAPAGPQVRPWLSGSTPWLPRPLVKGHVALQVYSISLWIAV